MNYIQLLERFHDARSDMGLYFEIGSRQGRSLTISKARNSIAVDPEFNITWPIQSPSRVFKMTSDAFFATRADAVIDRPIDMAFIDGMHLSEFALRDFINVERYCAPDAWVIIDDVLPYKSEIASRTRNTQQWTGDIYKLIPLLKTYRPDLSVTVFDVEVKGLMLVKGMDPENRVLSDNYDAIEQELMANDDPVISLDEIRRVAEPVPPESFDPVA